MIGRPSCAIGWTPHKRSLPRHGKAKIGRARKANDAQDEAAALSQAADVQRALGRLARAGRVALPLPRHAATIGAVGASARPSAAAPSRSAALAARGLSFDGGGLCVPFAMHG